MNEQEYDANVRYHQRRIGDREFRFRDEERFDVLYRDLLKRRKEDVKFTTPEKKE